MAKRTIAMCLAILLASFICIVAVPVVKAQSPPLTVYVDPTPVESVALVPGSLFNVSVKVDNIPTSPGLAGVEFDLTWNSSLLNGVRMQEIMFHEVTPESEWSNIWQLGSAVSSGSVHYAYTFMNLDQATAGGYLPISGSHTIANITLKVIGVGKCPLNFSVSKLSDPNGYKIDHDTVNGSFNNLPSPPAPRPALLYVDPPKTVNSSLIPGNNFTINIKIINASGVSDLEFELGFNASALHANSVANGSFIPSSATTITQIDNAVGFVKFNVSLTTSLDGNGTLAVIQLQVEADHVRNSTFHLYSVKLVDDAGEPLPFTTADGSFTNVQALLGDVNQDGIVDIHDAVIAAHSFGYSTGEANWNPEVDLDGNGTIDIFDIILLAANFGHKA